MSPYDSSWQRVRLTVLERDGWRCQIEGPGCVHAASHVDHIVALNEGGRRLDLDNLRAACDTCNTRRGRLRQAELSMFALRPPVVSAGASREW